MHLVDITMFHAPASGGVRTYLKAKQRVLAGRPDRPYLAAAVVIWRLVSYHLYLLTGAPGFLVQACRWLKGRSPIAPSPNADRGSESTSDSLFFRGESHPRHYDLPSLDLAP